MSTKRKERSGPNAASPSPATTTRPGTSGGPGYVGFYKTKVPNAEKKYKPFNNLERSPFTIPSGSYASQLNPAVTGVRFEGVENAFQLLKFPPEMLQEGDVAMFARSSGAVAFYLGSIKASSFTANMQKDQQLKDKMLAFRARQLPMRPGWDTDDVKIRLMKELVSLKFKQNPRLKALLLSTGSLPIVERSPTDGVWGDANKKKPELGPGRNLLGKLLVEVRDGLRQAPQNTKAKKLKQ